MSDIARIGWLGVVLWIASCGLGRRTEPPEPVPARRPAAPVEPATGGLYTAEAALRDALASPLQYVGTGTWPGIRRMFACAFRNERVLVVNVYCSPTDRQALRVAIYSPERGRVSIYAEAKGGVSAQRRADYFTFMVEGEPSAQPVSLGMTFDALRAYEDQRYAAFLPQCFAGQELSRERSGCLGPLAPRAGDWVRFNQAFLERANDDWYRLVTELRAQAVQHGREPN